MSVFHRAALGLFFCMAVLFSFCPRAYADASLESLEARVHEFYQHLAAGEYGATWDMLAESLRAGNHRAAYVADMERFFKFTAITVTYSVRTIVTTSAHSGKSFVVVTVTSRGDPNDRALWQWEFRWVWENGNWYIGGEGGEIFFRELKVFSGESARILFWEVVTP